MSVIKAGLFLVLMVSLPLGCSIAFSKINAEYMVGYVPAKFGLQNTYSEGVCSSSFFHYVGAFAIGIDDQTVREIESLGIQYFDEVELPRDSSKRIAYRDWKETPAPPSSETRANFGCSTIRGLVLPSGFHEALATPGSFYSDDLRGKSAVVIPSLGIIAISMQTR